MICDFDNGRIYHSPLGEDKFHPTILDMKLMLKIKRQRYPKLIHTKIYKDIQSKVHPKISDDLLENICDEFIFRTVTVKTDSNVEDMNFSLQFLLQKKCDHLTKNVF